MCADLNVREMLSVHTVLKAETSTLLFYLVLIIVDGAESRAPEWDGGSRIHGLYVGIDLAVFTRPRTYGICSGIFDIFDCICSGILYTKKIFNIF